MAQSTADLARMYADMPVASACHGDPRDIDVRTSSPRTHTVTPKPIGPVADMSWWRGLATGASSAESQA